MNNINSAVSEEDRFKIGNRITWITIIINIALAVIKVSVGIIFNSSAMLADGIHTISDIGSSIGIIIGFIISKKPEDIEHQYGHEKAESIAAFVLSIFLTGVGIKIGYSAFVGMVTGSLKTPGIMAAWVAFFSIFIKELQFRIAMYGGKKINSSALIADAWHHRSDALSSIGALVGILGARIGYPILDSIAALIVSAIVIKVGVEIFIKGYNELMDTSIEEEKLRGITAKILSNTDVLNINEIKARIHGSKVYVDLKICVKESLSVKIGHDISEDVENIVFNSISNVKAVLVHVNPCPVQSSYNCSSCKNETTVFLTDNIKNN